jgi:hypothetical protein
VIDLDESARRAAVAARREAEELIDARAGLAELHRRAGASSRLYAVPSTRGWARWRNGTARTWVVVGTSVAVAAALVAGVFMVREPDRRITPAPVATEAPTPISSPTEVTEVTEVTVVAPQDTTGAPQDTTGAPGPDEETTTSMETTTTVAPPMVFTSVGVQWACAVGCPQLAVTPSGRVVLFDTERGFMLVDSTGALLRTVPLAVGHDVTPGGAILVYVSDDEVAYVLVGDEVPDPVGTLYAISLAEDNAGVVLVSLSGMDMSGDSDLAATAGGLVVVGCCGNDLVRPSPDVEPAMAWMHSDGGPPETQVAAVRIELGAADGSADIVRIDPDGAERRWTVTDVVVPRGVPRLIPTDDGGAMAALPSGDDPFSNGRIVRVHPDGTATEVDVSPWRVTALEPGGSAIVSTDVGPSDYARITLG